MLKHKTVLYTETTPEEARDAECLIINCFGLLSSIYRYGEIAYVGGGFGVGIHNVLEAAVWNVPVGIGPNNKRFQEAQELLADGGCFEIASYDDFSQIMSRFTSDHAFLNEAGNKAAAYVKKKAGATAKILSDVKL
jgi:3-deoxy-D-manno-octulosonic-acid transferase